MRCLSLSWGRYPRLRLLRLKTHIPRETTMMMAPPTILSTLE
jgi:hypothetical protein